MILSDADNCPPMLDKDLTKKYAELSAADKIQADCNMKATNIILQGLPADIYSLERGCKLYDAFDKFTHIKGGSLHTLPPEWSKFVTDVKLVKDLHTSNYDQLHAYLEQHELYANEVCLMCFAIPMFSLGDDLIAYRNKAMDFLTMAASLSAAYKGNATSLRGNTASRQARVVKCYNCQGKGHMARQCTQPKRPRNTAWYKEKAMLVEAQKARQMLDEEQLAFLVDLGIPASQAQTIITHNAAFQTEDLNTYDFDCDDISTA
nr:hypothetical protein [Tanacetum cinerariifolium]